MRRSRIWVVTALALGALPGCRARGSACAPMDCGLALGRHPTPAVTTPSGPRRSAAALEEGFRRSMEEKAFVPLLSDAEAHEAMPTLFQGRALPNLMLATGRMPKTTEALMSMAKAMRTEGKLDSTLLNDVFWAVSSENECFY